jgi:hypothetical protein
VIAELWEDDDDAQLEVAKMLAKGRSRIRPAVMGRGGQRLEPWSCRVEHEGVRRVGADLGSLTHTGGSGG